MFVVGTTDGSVVAPGVKKAYWNVPAAGTITRWKVISDVTGSAVVRALKSSALPTFTTLGDATLTSALSATGVVSWAVAKDDVLDIQVISNTASAKIVLELTLT